MIYGGLFPWKPPRINIHFKFRYATALVKTPILHFAPKLERKVVIFFFYKHFEVLAPPYVVHYYKFEYKLCDIYVHDDRDIEKILFLSSIWFSFM